MKAPQSAINHIIKSFNGEEKIDENDGRLVAFWKQEDTDNVISLVEMLNGWNAYKCPNILHAVRIHKVT